MATSLLERGTTRTTFTDQPAPRLRPGNVRQAAGSWPQLQQNEVAAAGQENHEIHREQHQVVVPAICPASPKADLPHEDLLLYRTEHEEDQPDGSELCEDPERHAHAPEDFRGAEKHREPGARPDALRPLGGVLEVIPPAIEEHDGHHEPQQQQTDVAEAHEDRERDAHLRLSVRLPRVAPQLRRRLVDAADVRPHGLAARASGHDEVAVGRARGPPVVDPQGSPPRPPPRLQPPPRGAPGPPLPRAPRRRPPPSPG